MVLRSLRQMRYNATCAICDTIIGQEWGDPMRGGDVHRWMIMYVGPPAL